MSKNIYNIENSIELLIKKFNIICKKGWILKESSNDGEAGNNIEILLGKENNNFPIPDFNGIEIKTKKERSFNNYITLFNCIPYGESFFETQRIREKYGYPDSTFKQYKILNGDVFCNIKKKIGVNFFFKLKIDKKKKKIFLLVYDKFNKEIDNSTYWPFDVLSQKLFCKLQYLALIKVAYKYYNGKKYYKYNNLQIYKLKSFNAFLDLLEKQKIKISFKIGIYKSGNKFGKMHDRGTGFEIDINYINLLYEKIY